MDPLPMKKIILFCLILLGCEKEPIPEEPTFCWDCWKEVKTDHQSMSLEVDFCGLTDEEMQEIIDLNTNYSKDSTNYFRLRCVKR